MVASYDLWPGNGVGLFSKEKISKQNWQKKDKWEAHPHDVNKQTRYTAQKSANQSTVQYSPQPARGWVSRHQKGKAIVNFNEARDEVALASAGPYRGFRAQRFYLKKSKFFRKRVFVFCKFYFVILPTCSGNCILIFTPLESSLKVLSNCLLI